MSERASSVNRRVAPPQLPPGVSGGAPGPTTSEAAPPPPRRSGRLVAWLTSALGLVLVVSTSIAVAWGARRYLVTSPRFAVVDVRITGTSRVRPDEARARAALEEGVNIFTLDLDAARERLLEDPWIKEAELARRLPGTVSVHITEREAVAVLALPEVYLVAKDGDVMKRLSPGDPADLPVITGITASGDGDRSALLDEVGRALDLIAEYERSGLGARYPLQEVHLAADGSASLTVGKQGVALALGGGPYRRKLEQASKVLAEVDRQAAKAEAVLLDNEARPDRVVVRMR